MIIAKTKLKKIPDSCSKCKFSIATDKFDYKDFESKDTGFIRECYIQKRCMLTGAKIPYMFNKEKQSWGYTKCKSCPLVEEG